MQLFTWIFQQLNKLIVMLDTKRVFGISLWDYIFYMMLFSVIAAFILRLGGGVRWKDTKMSTGKGDNVRRR